MEKLPQDYIMNIAFGQSVQREELLIEKYSDYCEAVKDKELKEMIKDFEKQSYEHIRLLKDKMSRLNINLG